MVLKHQSTKETKTSRPVCGYQFSHFIYSLMASIYTCVLLGDMIPSIYLIDWLAPNELAAVGEPRSNLCTTETAVLGSVDSRPL